MKKFLSRSENAMEEMIEGTAPSVGKPSFDLADDEIRFFVSVPKGRHSSHAIQTPCDAFLVHK